MKRQPATLEGAKRAMEYNDAQHYLNSPAHGHALVRSLHGVFDSLDTSMVDDPALAAYQIKDALPRIAGYLRELKVWTVAVIRAGPDDIPTTGARL